MAQDYAPKSRRTTKKRRNEPRIPAWVWLFTGAVLGAFIMFLMKLSDMKTSGPTTSDITPRVSDQQKENDRPKPKFDFYEMLKENKVVVPENTNSDKTQPIVEEADLEYILQVASFKNATDAEQLRAELILLNLEARTEKAKLSNRETWHRVLVGPFTSRSMLSKARSTLISNEYEALVLKRPKQES